jgi:hypothetical protein
MICTHVLNRQGIALKDLKTICNQLLKIVSPASFQKFLRLRNLAWLAADESDKLLKITFSNSTGRSQK